MTEQKDEQPIATAQGHTGSSSAATTARSQWWRALLQGVVVIALLLLGFTFLFMVRATPLVMHEIFGVVVVAIVLWHVYLLRSFFGFVGGQRQAVFVYRDIVLLGLIVSFVLTVLSGLCISHILFKGVFISHENFGFWRRMHTFASAYFLMFIGLHLGCYLLKFGSWLSESLAQVVVPTTKSKSEAQSSGYVTAKVEKKDQKQEHQEAEATAAAAVTASTATASAADNAFTTSTASAASAADTSTDSAAITAAATPASESRYAAVRTWLERGLWAGLLLICINGAIQSVQGGFLQPFALSAFF